MRGFDTSERNVTTQADALKYGAEAGVRSTGIQAGASMFDSSNRLKAAQTPYEKLLRAEQLAYDEGGMEGLQQFRAATNPGSENMRLMRLSNQQELENQRRSAYGATMDQLNRNFEDQTTGFFSLGGALEFDDNRTKQIETEMDRLKTLGVPESQAYEEALGTVSRRLVDARFGSRPGVNEILRDDRYDVPQGRGLSTPTAAPTNAAPGRMFNPRGRGIQRPVQQPATGNWPPNE